MRRLTAIGLILCGALLAAAAAGAAAKPVVPRAVQLRILRSTAALAYVPTRTASGFHYVGWQKSPSNLEITFDNRAGWEIRFVALRASGSCRTGMEKSFQLDGKQGLLVAHRRRADGLAVRHEPIRPAGAACCVEPTAADEGSPTSASAGWSPRGKRISAS
jgi:hypothetical protein